LATALFAVTFSVVIGVVLGIAVAHFGLMKKVDELFSPSINVTK
jgi:ABC-type dipeptide/oligopeptide/nickel transport system permease subunit